MQRNNVFRKINKRHVLAALCLAVAGTITVTSFGVRGRGTLPDKHAQRVISVNLSVQDPRPLAKALDTLEAKYGWVITYEDPRYAYEEEIVDVTDTIRNPLHKNMPGQLTRVLVPKGGYLAIDYNVMADTGLPIDREAVIQHLLDVNSANGNAGQFRLERTGNVLHVIPTASKNRSGEWSTQESVLDAVISLPEEERSSTKTVDAICAAISHTTNTQLGAGTIPLNQFLQHRDQHGAINEKARNVLLRTLENTGTNLSWRLFYDPGIKMYALNIHQVPSPNSYSAKPK
jgi:hypothetical protein